MLYRQADEVRLWANIIGHEELAEDTLAGEDLDQLLSYLELLFDTLYVQPARLAELQAKRKGAS